MVYLAWFSDCVFLQRNFYLKNSLLHYLETWHNCQPLESTLKKCLYYWSEIRMRIPTSFRYNYPFQNDSHKTTLLDHFLRFSKIIILHLIELYLKQLRFICWKLSNMAVLHLNVSHLQSNLIKWGIISLWLPRGCYFWELH